MCHIHVLYLNTLFKTYLYIFVTAILDFPAFLYSQQTISKVVYLGYVCGNYKGDDVMMHVKYTELICFNVATDDIFWLLQN